VKAFERTQSSQAETNLVARVVINYEANCKLDPKEYGTSADALEFAASARNDFMTRMKKITKLAHQGDKENTNFLDEVEKNILNRRRKGQNADDTNEKNYSSKALLATTSRPTIKANPNRGALSRSTNKLQPLGQTITPDSLYNAYNTEAPASSQKIAATDQLMQRMAQELNLNKQEIKSLSEKLKGLEEGQMTVDNIELAKRLDQERDALNNERMVMLKEYASKVESAESELQRAEKERLIAEEAILRAKSQLEEQRKKYSCKKFNKEHLKKTWQANGRQLKEQRMKFPGRNMNWKHNVKRSR
jgi:ribosomal protein S20